MGTFNTVYKEMVATVLAKGSRIEGRNGNTIALPFSSFIIGHMETDWRLRLRKMFYKGVLGEFKTLIDPAPLTNVSQFEANGCNYWSDWAGPNGELILDYHDKLHPQFTDVIEQIKTNPSSRRHVVSLWDHDNLDNLSLPCCWYSLVFIVLEGTLHLTWTQRSVDIMIGLPSDVYLAHLFMQHVAEQTDLAIGSCMFALSNIHIYEEHEANAFRLLLRTEADQHETLKFQLKA